ncbi:MAG: C-terminal helicase domain-containing protein, partial [bacterium]
VENVEHELFIVAKDQKPHLLERLLGEYRGTVLVFTRTKFGAKKLAALVRRWNHTSAELHSNRSLGQRRQALDGFKSGAFRVLVATDIAARGLDVTGIELVVNYDLPSQAEDYVHRVGRTARAGRAGKAISFAQPDQQRDVRDIERLIRIKLPVSRVPNLPQQPQFVETESRQRPERPFRGSQRPARPFGYQRGGHVFRGRRQRR